MRTSRDGICFLWLERGCGALHRVLLCADAASNEWAILYRELCSHCPKFHDLSMSWNNVVFLTLQSFFAPQPSSSRICSLSACPRMLAMILAASSQDVSCGDRTESSFSSDTIERQVDTSDGGHCDIGRMWGSEGLASGESHSISEMLSGFLLMSLKSILGPEKDGSTLRRSNCALSCNVLMGGSLRSGSGWLWIGGGSVRERKWVSTGGVGA